MPQLKNEQILVALQGVRTLQAERLSTMTGVKLRRMARELATAHDDVNAERITRLKMHAKVKEDGELEQDKDGRAIFATPEAEATFQAELKELYEGETEIKETLTIADLKRRERDEAGKVYETDDVPAVVIDQLGDLLVIEETAERRAVPIAASLAELPWGPILTLAGLLAAIGLLAMDERNRRKFATRDLVVDKDGRPLFPTKEETDASIRRAHRRIDENRDRVDGAISLMATVEDRVGDVEERAALLEERTTQHWERMTERMSETAKMNEDTARRLEQMGGSLQDLTLRLERLNRGGEA